MTEKPKLVYDAPKRQHLYEWQFGEYLWASEPVFDRTREYVEVLEAENAKLRELVADMWFWSYEGHIDGESQERQMLHIDAVIQRMRELGVEVNE